MDKIVFFFLENAQNMCIAVNVTVFYGLFPFQMSPKLLIMMYLKFYPTLEMKEIKGIR